MRTQSRHGCAVGSAGRSLAALVLHQLAVDATHTPVPRWVEEDHPYDEARYGQRGNDQEEDNASAYGGRHDSYNEVAGCSVTVPAHRQIRAQQQVEADTWAERGRSGCSIAFAYDRVGWGMGSTKGVRPVPASHLGTRPVDA